MFKNNFDKNLKICSIKRSFGYGFYFRNYIFEGVNLKTKSLLDLGGGNGIASFFAAHSDNSCRCTIVDPFEDGSNTLMITQYEKLSKVYGNAVKLHKGYVESLPIDEKFDIILMHNSINHIGEEIIADIVSSQKYWKEFSARLEPIIMRAKKGATIIVADCSNKNFWNDLGIKNPLAPTIEWNLHQPPRVWQKMLENFRCKHLRTNWTSRREFLFLGKFLLANKFLSYFTDSHFVSTYIKK